MKKLFPDLLVLILGLTISSILLASGTQPPGSGTSGDPYLVSTLDHLLWISTNSSSWGSYFKQTANIDATDTQNWNSGSGFSPIGHSITKFTGTYDGQNYTIDSLYINRVSQQYIGLFGKSNGATIQNLGLSNIYVRGNDYVSGLVGYCSSSNLSNCYCTGNIYGNGSYVGGVSGYISASTINSCYNSCSVDGNENHTGGLLGYNSGATIKNCYSTGSVDGAGYYLGGLAGSMNSTTTINSCYSTGNVVYHSNYYGGLVGYNNGGNIINSFWDTQTSGLSSSSGGSGKTTSEMKTLATFTDETTTGLSTAWDFVTNPNDDVSNEDIWDMDLSGSINSGYPYLSWQDGGDQSLPVELTTFTAKNKNGVVLLEWSTESEIENLGFILERKTEQSDWTEIANYKSDSGLRGHGSTSMRHTYQYLDKTVQPGMTYEYRLGDVDYRGIVTWHKTVEIALDDHYADSPTEFVLRSAYPNPFNPKISIPLALPEAAEVRIAIFDITGREVKILFRGKSSAGWLNLVWDGSDARGKTVSAGIYFLSCNLTSLSSGRIYRFNQKIVMVK